MSKAKAKKVQLAGKEQVAKKSQFDMVKEFHEIFGHPIKTAPKVPEMKRAKLRLDLILEEVAELVDAVSGCKEEHRYLQAAVLSIHRAQKLIADAPAYEFKKADMEHVAKELSDVSYVTQGFALEFGFNLDATMGEVHSSNMSKLGENGKPIYNEKNKVMKGPNYELPNMTKILYPLKENAA